MVHKSVTYWLDEGPDVCVQREDTSVYITAYADENPTSEGVEIRIGPSLFPAIREAMDKAEAARKP
jgi:hypothetical protein